LLADGYDGYNGVVAGNGITRSGCWSHARRKYVEAEKTAPEIAREAVALISALYAVEKQAKDVSVAERRELRQAQSTPVLAELRRKLLLWKEQLIPKTSHGGRSELHPEPLNAFCSTERCPSTIT
jgi:transposase